MPKWFVEIQLFFSGFPSSMSNVTVANTPLAHAQRRGIFRLSQLLDLSIPRISGILVPLASIADLKKEIAESYGVLTEDGITQGSPVEIGQV